MAKRRPHWKKPHCCYFRTVPRREVPQNVRGPDLIARKNPVTKIVRWYVNDRICIRCELGNDVDEPRCLSESIDFPEAKDYTDTPIADSSLPFLESKVVPVTDNTNAM